MITKNAILGWKLSWGTKVMLRAFPESAGNTLNSLTAIRFRREQKLPPRRIPTVGIVQKVLSTTNTTIHKHHHHGGVICPSYDVGSMDLPDLMVVTSLEGVGQEHLAWV
jgi:hypothetical protein